DVDEVRHVVLDEMKLRVSDQMGDVVRAPRNEVVHADHPVPFGDEAVTEVRAEEAGAAGNQRSGSSVHASPFSLGLKCVRPTYGDVWKACPASAGTARTT